MEKELDEAYSQIQQQKKLIKELKDQAKENNIELTKAYNDLKNKEKNLENKNTNVVNKETRVMKLQAKESLKEWKEVHDNVQEHGKALKGMLEKALNEKIHDNLDLEIESKTGKGYATPIMVYLNKCQKYQNQIQLLLENQKQTNQEMDRLKQSSKLKDGVKMLTELERILQRDDETTKYFEDLMKLAKQQKYVNSKEFNVSADEPEVFLEAIHNYFDSHGDYYRELRDLIKSKNKKIKKLEEFKKNVEMGKNKDAVIEDLQNIYEKVRKSNKHLQKILLIADAESDSNLHPEADINKAEETLLAVQKEFIWNEAKEFEVEKIIEDLMEEKKQNVLKLKEFQVGETIMKLDDLEDIKYETDRL